MSLQWCGCSPLFACSSGVLSIISILYIHPLINVRSLTMAANWNQSKGCYVISNCRCMVVEPDCLEMGHLVSCFCLFWVQLSGPFFILEVSAPIAVSVVEVAIVNTEQSYSFRSSPCGQGFRVPRFYSSTSHIGEICCNREYLSRD